MPVSADDEMQKMFIAHPLPGTRPLRPLPLDRVNLIALPTRLVKICLQLPGSPIP